MTEPSLLLSDSLLCAYVTQLATSDNQNRWVALIRGRLETFKMMLNVLAITKSINEEHVTKIISECRRFIVVADNLECFELIRTHVEDAERIITTLEGANYE